MCQCQQQAYLCWHLHTAAQNQSMPVQASHSHGHIVVLQSDICLSLLQVQHSAMHAKQKAKGVMRDMKKLGNFRRPKLGKTAKFCLRILAQVGVLGAAL